MHIIIGSDHGGYQLKQEIIARCKANNIFITDKGTFSEESVDYPDIAHAVCVDVIKNIENNEGNTENAIKNIKENYLGILVCGTGIGMAITANKIPHIRAAVLHTIEEARLAKEHNKCNVICFGGRTMQKENVFACIQTFLSATFEGERHARRIQKITTLEQMYKNFCQ